MAAELGAQRGKQLFSEGVVAARAEARVERGRQHVGGDFLFDRRVNGPASFARVGDLSDKLCELRVAGKRQRREVEQPRADDAAAPPEFGDLRKLEVVPLIFRQRARSRRCA